MNEQLVKFIELCLVDGIITDTERKVIFRKSEEYGVPLDECEIILESMIHKHTKLDLPSISREKIDLTSNKNIPIKKIKKTEVLNFDKKKKLEIEIEKYVQKLEKNIEFVNKTKESNQEIKTRLQENKTKLKKNVVTTLSKIKKGSSISLGELKFKVNEKILKNTFKNYLRNHGTIQWGNKNDKNFYKPTYPHPISVLYNHVELGHEVKLDGRYLSGYLQGNKFQYFTSEPKKVLDLDKERPDQVLIFNKEKNCKCVILLFKDYIKTYEIEYWFHLKSIDYKKGILGIDKIRDGSYYFTSLVVSHKEIDIYKDLVL